MARGKHRKHRVLKAREIATATIAGLAAATVMVGWTPLFQTTTTTAKPTVQLDAYRTPARLVALHWALTQWGAPYAWGGTGPYWSGYDCSGLVMMAYRHAGIYLPRTTYEMLGSWHLVPIPRSEARWGDLAFYGTGHVELYFGNDVVNLTYGAHDFGTVVSPAWFNAWWHPTMYFRVR